MFGPQFLDKGEIDFEIVYSLERVIQSLHLPLCKSLDILLIDHENEA